ncbi:hypothetical protein G8S49_11300 [Clostridium botulinum C]|uniref:Uncharacterized protein n=2 Tax=Clostridium botulinum TaxID=1491 RepID=A0A9Q4TGD9_CLOBO|nr:hypothetical protein [Clostridium botulinum]EGO86222.1 hypothetical protein CBCST_22940 [Clostridium botulinum C str. Stockholm]MCD3195739.1 hypothetical protein [Clostridium botulinum C]MCD3201155.1 hypothetical protein [Clostridium botulinum C]MCD3207117.1 hypothetical protein [Clostridium botulinum C]MCD3209696.1 hypothetical protein [Clostridium botulinum C]
MNKFKFTIELYDFTEDEVKQIATSLGLEMPENKIDYEISGEFEDNEENWIWLRSVVLNTGLTVRIELKC